MLRFLHAAFYILLSSPVLAASSVSIPGTNMPCDGGDHYFIWMPVCPVLPSSSYPGAVGCYTISGGASYPPGNAWPSSSFTIWATNLTTATNDPNAVSQIGLLGLDGDTLTPILLGQGFVRQVEPANGRKFDFSVSSERIDFHVVCAPGKSATINAAFTITVP